MFAEIKGTRIYYETVGESGSKVLLLHGWGCSGELMKGVAETLGENHLVLIPDFPGHGKSGRPPEPWGVPDYADAVKELLDTLGFYPCDIVAHSFGCRVGAWAAKEWPDYFCRLVFTGAAGLRAAESEAGRKKAARYRELKKVALGIGKIPGLKKLGGHLEDALREKYGSRDYNALDPEMRKTFVRVVQQDLREVYPSIRQSTLLIWGDQDTETPMWMGREMEKLIPDAGLVVLEGGSHFAYLEQAPRFNIIVKHFLTET